jgi:hypothetical protein
VHDFVNQERRESTEIFEIDTKAEKHNWCAAASPYQHG